jgi:acyl carrier protein
VLKDEIKSTLRSVVLEILYEKGIDKIPTDEESLVFSGMIDSLGIVTIATILENDFGLDLSLITLSQSDFDTIESIVELVWLNTKDV